MSKCQGTYKIMENDQRRVTVPVVDAERKNPEAVFVTINPNLGKQRRMPMAATNHGDAAKKELSNIHVLGDVRMEGVVRVELIEQTGQKPTLGGGVEKSFPRT